MKKILSIDGGGIRGIVAAYILSYLEQEKQKVNPAYRLSDSFDLIAGTSTGAILALGLLTPNKEIDSTIKTRYTAEDLQKLYQTNGSEIFDTSLFIRLISNFSNETYDATNFEKLLLLYFGDIKYSELLKPCLVTTYDTYNRTAMFFNSVDAIKTNTNDFYVKDIARATSAAPTYFEAAIIKSLVGEKFTLIDGGLVANNPTACALVELIKMENNVGNKINLSEITIISIGTGLNTNKKKYEYHKIKDYGKLKWAAPVIDILMSSSVETVHYQMKTLYGSSNMKENYYRINAELNKASTEMDDATEHNIEALLQDAKDYVRENQDTLNAIVKIL